MAKPTESYEWATEDLNDVLSGEPNKLEPTEEFKLSGTKRAEPLPRAYDNYWRDAVKLHLDHLYTQIADLQSQIDALTP